MICHYIPRPLSQYVATHVLQRTIYCTEAIAIKPTYCHVPLSIRQAVTRQLNFLPIFLQAHNMEIFDGIHGNALKLLKAPALRLICLCVVKILLMTSL